ncbi:MAG: sigma-70 family RNA polymerase sigma factor [Thermoleophilaceae bacterium]
MIRHGNSGAFDALVQRYQPRLLAFCRHMLSSQEDAEDVLQEVFAASYNALLADERPINARPWLYRIARNRCLNHLRRPRAAGQDSMDIFEIENGATTAETVHQREEFRQIVADVQELPETQRTALLLREIDALSYDQIAEAMDTTVPSVKSLLVRARVGLAEASEARLLTCGEVRTNLGEVAEGLSRTTAPVRRHLKACERCRIFRAELRSTSKALAAVFPITPADPAQEVRHRQAGAWRRRRRRIGRRIGRGRRSRAGRRRRRHRRGWGRRRSHLCGRRHPGLQGSGGHGRRGDRHRGRRGGQPRHPAPARGRSGRRRGPRAHPRDPAGPQGPARTGAGAATPQGRGGQGAGRDQGQGQGRAQATTRRRRPPRPPLRRPLRRPRRSPHRRRCRLPPRRTRAPRRSLPGPRRSRRPRPRPSDGQRAAADQAPAAPAQQQPSEQHASAGAAHHPAALAG